MRGGERRARSQTIRQHEQGLQRSYSPDDAGTGCLVKTEAVEGKAQHKSCGVGTQGVQHTDTKLQRTGRRFEVNIDNSGMFSERSQRMSSGWSDVGDSDEWG